MDCLALGLAEHHQARARASQSRSSASMSTLRRRESLILSIFLTFCTFPNCSRPLVCVCLRPETGVQGKREGATNAAVSKEGTTQST